MVLAGSPSIQIDLRFSLDHVGVINNLLQDLYSKIEQIFFKKMLVERKNVSDFEQLIKE